VDEATMQKVAEELVNLSKKYGDDDHGNRKLKIPAMHDEAMEFIRKFSYKMAGTFSADDPQVIRKAQDLMMEGYRTVWALYNAPTLRYELYVPPDKRTWSEVKASQTPAPTLDRKSVRSTYASARTGSEAYSQSRILRKKEEAKRRQKRVEEKKAQFQREHTDLQNKQKVYSKQEQHPKEVPETGLKARLLQPLANIINVFLGKK
jgi:hypothetical protein